MTEPGRPLRAAIVGAGLMGEWHMRTVPRAGAVVSTVIDSDPDRASRLSRLGRSCRAESSLAAAVRAGEPIDVAHICTPPDTHEALVAESLEAGLHVLVEKPLAPTLAGSRRLLDLAVEKKRLVCPVYQFVCQDGFRKALSHLSAIGGVRHVDVVACSAGSDAPGAPPRDAVAADILLHALSLVSRLLPGALVGGTWQGHHAGPGEIRAMLSARSATASLLVSMSGRPTRATCRVIGDGGTIHVDLFHGFAVVERRRPSRSAKAIGPIALSLDTALRATVNLGRRALVRETAFPGLRALMAGFYDAVRTGGAPPIDRVETLEIAAARDGIVRGWLPGTDQAPSSTSLL